MKADRVRVLLIESPGFGQDVEALLAGAPVGVEMALTTTQDIGAQFLRVFPLETLGLDLGLWKHERFTEARAKWAVAARKLVRDLYALFPFELVLAPADDTPYLREFVAAVKELGAPYVVLMKEVLRPPYQFESWAPQIAQHLPVIADYVCVNSNMNRDYILRTGGIIDRVAVTGQPRFDVYARQGEPPPRDRTLRVLFLSYEFDVYLPLALRAKLNGAPSLLRDAFGQIVNTPSAIDGIETWLSQRATTLRLLAEAATQRKFTLVVKSHPQMSSEDAEFDARILREYDDTGKVCMLAPQFCDTRALILDADVVVGFQTTALLEALAAGKHVVYTHWSPQVDVYSSGLMPYWELGDILTVVRDPRQLMAACERTACAVDNSRVRVSEVVKQWLGEVDGQATARVWRVVEQVHDGARHAAANRSIASRTLSRTRWLIGLRAFCAWLVWGSVSRIVKGHALDQYVQKQAQRLSMAWFMDRAVVGRARPLPAVQTSPIRMAIKRWTTAWAPKPVRNEGI